MTNKFALALRIFSIFIRLVFTLLAFYLNTEIARQLLYVISFIYLWQIIGGMEIYLNVNKNIDEHLKLIRSSSLIIIPIFVSLVFFKSLSIIIIIYFLFDFLLIEFSRKQAVNNNVYITSEINLFRSLIFSLSVIFIVYLRLDQVILINALGSLALCFYYPIIRRNFLQFENLKEWINAVKFVGKKSIPVAIINRSTDVVLREANSSYDFLGTVLDLLISYCGVGNVIIFYLLIASSAEKYLKGVVVPNSRKYFFSILIYIIGIISALCIIIFYESEILIQENNFKHVVLVCLILLLSSIFQVISWCIIGSKENTLITSILYISCLSAITITIFNYENLFQLYIMFIIIILSIIMGIIVQSKKFRKKL